MTSKILILLLSTIGLNAQTLVLQNDWNLKSANELISKDSFNQPCIDIVWKYNVENGWSAYSYNTETELLISNSEYTTIGSIATGEGFWLKANSACNIETTSTTTTVDSSLVSPGLPGETTQPTQDTSLLSQGWNLKGTSTVLTNTTFDKECIEVLWKYDPVSLWSGYSNNSTISDTITNKFSTISTEDGFWVKTTTTDCNLLAISTTDTTTTDDTTTTITVVDVDSGYTSEFSYADYLASLESSTTTTTTDDTTTTTTDDTTTTTTDDTVVEPVFTEYTINTGFITNPSIWQDTNDNLILDSGEAVGIKKTDTSYTISVVDSTKNILLKGGTDSRDGTAFDGIMLTKLGITDSDDNTNISIATSFFVILKDNGTILLDDIIVTTVNQIVGTDYTLNPLLSETLNEFELKIYKTIESMMPSGASAQDIYDIYKDIALLPSTTSLNTKLPELFGAGSDMVKTFLYDLMLLIDEQTLDAAGYIKINEKVVENISLYSKYPKVTTKQVLQGKVMGGYIATSTIFQDLNKNIIKDLYEPYVTSNSEGVYSNLSIYDNTLDIPIVSIGGIDKSYDSAGTYAAYKDFIGVLSTFPEIIYTDTDSEVYNYITPLTNLIVLNTLENDVTIDESKIAVFELIDDTNYRVPSNNTELLKDPLLHSDENNKLFNVHMSIFKDTEAVSFTKEDYTDYSKKLLETTKLYLNFEEILYRNFSETLSDNSKEKLFTMNTTIHHEVQPTVAENNTFTSEVNTFVYQIKNDIQTIMNDDTNTEEEVEIVEPEVYASLTLCEEKLVDTTWKSLKSSTNSFVQDDTLPIWLRSLRPIYDNEGLEINSDITIIYENITNSTTQTDDRTFSQDGIFEVKYTPLHELKMFYIYYDDLLNDSNDICNKIQFPAIDVYTDPFVFTTEEVVPDTPN